MKVASFEFMCPIIVAFAFLGIVACASRPPEPPGTGVRVEVDEAKVPVSVPCSAAQKLGPDPPPVLTPERVNAIPHPNTKDHREKEENWLYLTGLLLEQIEVLLLRDQVEDNAYREC